MAGQPASEHPPRALSARPKVIYVMGAGRSGSTILGVALGNCEGVFFAGELDRWLARSGEPRQAGERRGAFWRAVRERMHDPDKLRGARTTWIERSSTLLDPRKWAGRERLRVPYRRASEDLYLATAQVADAAVVVDTSHYPMRARELQPLEGIELFLILLVRDPQRVVASLGRDDVPERRFGVLAANAYLFLTYLLATWVFLRHPRERRMLVHHEDLLARPAGVVEEILRRCGSGGAAPDMTALHTGVPFHGNRLVQAETVALGGGEAAPARSSALTALIQLPWRVVLSRLRPVVRG